MITGSQLDRVNACPASASLGPRVEITTEYSERGKSAHRLLRAAVTGEDYDVGDAPDDIAEALDDPSITKGQWLSEGAYWFDPETYAVGYLGEDLHRDYSGAPPGSIPFTIDLVGLTDGAVIVGDLKSGFGKLPRPAASWQFRLAAIACAKYYRRPRAILAMLRPISGRAVWITDEAATADLRRWRVELRGLMARADAARAKLEAGRMPDLHRGPWCRYCPARNACPAWRDTLVQIGRGTGKDLAMHLATPEDAAEAVIRIQAAEAALAEAEAVIAATKSMAYAILSRAGEATVSNGQTVRVASSTRCRVTDPELAQRVLADIVGDAASIMTYTPSTTLKAIDGAVREQAKATGQRIGPAIKDARRALLDAGAITQSERGTFEIE